MKVRFISLIGSTALVFLLLGYSLYSLQITKSQFYAERAKAQQIIRDSSTRGAIYFGDVPAAINRDFNTIYAVPTQIKDLPEALSQLKTALGLDPEKIQSLLSKSGSQYAELIVKATSEQVQAALQAEIPGIYVKTDSGRSYPFNSLAAHVVGYVSQEDKKIAPQGQYGIEARADRTLTGGDDVVLTIDPNIQARAEEVLKSLVDEYQPTGGSVIVEEPTTGKILAMGNWPTFDPNNYSQSPLANFRNPAVQAQFEPGSVMKPLTMAAGIDSGAITPETTYYDPGYFTANGKTIHNWDNKAHGTLTMTNVIEQSVNTGSVFAEQQMGHKTFYNYLLKFGFKELTHIDLLGEIAGKLTPLEKYPRDINFATAAYGQGMTTTPIRLITAISAIANHGVMVEPYIIAGDENQVSRQVVSADTARKVAQMMVSAVDKAKIAAIPQYRVAGKTGTAFLPDYVKGGYTEDVINTYVGFAPAYDPRFTILIKIDKPHNAPLAGTTVVPAFHDLAQFLLNYLDVPPDTN